MAKKKKTQLKPVVRGFATTSIPKKVVVDEDVTSENGPDVVDNATDGVQPPEDATQNQNGTVAEDDNIQILLDSLQEKTDKEVSRVVKVIEHERRMSVGLPKLDIDPNIRHAILTLIEQGATFDASGPKSLSQDLKSKLISQTGVTYGVLKQLGFSDNKIHDCLKAVVGSDFELAFDWMCCRCADSELAGYDDDRAITGSVTPMTPKPQSGISTPGPSTPLSRRDDLAPILPEVDKVEGPQTPAIEEPRENGIDPTFPEANYVHPNTEYAKLKSKLVDLTASRTGHNQQFIEQLRHRLTALQEDYFFSREDAEMEYKALRQQTEETNLLAQLRGTAPIPATPPKPIPKLPNTNRTASNLPAADDVFDDSDSDSGGLLQILEPVPSKISENGSTITVRDMATGKAGLGRMPKRLFQELVSKIDKLAVVSYRDVSGTSRAKRSMVKVGWSSGRLSEWVMSDIACSTYAEAEHYIATVAMHAILRPLSTAFTRCGIAMSSLAPFRLLPGPFKDLWDELEINRKCDEDSLNREIWRFISAVVEERLSISAKSGKDNAAIVTSTVHQPRLSSNQHFQTATHDRIIAEFQSRVNRSAYQEMLVHRNALPIAQYRGDIIQALEMSQVVVLSGETGCGKSTQLPSFILEDQLSKGSYCKILCTEPRRISAISLAHRVSCELGDSPGSVGTESSMVGYSIRLESNVSRNTCLTYATYGIALRMLEGNSGPGNQGTGFDDLTHVIIDEVHERSIESDFLLIILKSLVEKRRDLKVILMSATLDADKISKYFGGCPMLHVPGRTFPVEVLYLEDAVETTGWNITESSPFARRVSGSSQNRNNKLEWTEDAAPTVDGEDDAPHEDVGLERKYSPRTVSTVNLLDDRVIPYDLIIRLLEDICNPSSPYHQYSAAVLVFLPGLAEIRRLTDQLGDHPIFGNADYFQLHPLHSSISADSQGAVFELPPPGVRKLVIATNIAETGITIPDITCVIDSGKHREMRYDEKRQISRLLETWVAKSNAAQRRGRAGRVQPGVCFHLFTKSHHDKHMAGHPLPEMMRLSLSDLGLRIKTMKVTLGSSIEDVLLRALDPPSPVNIQRAVTALVEVQALTNSEELTPLGRILSKFPTDVHLGKFLLVATSFRCLDPALTIAATLSSKSPFVTPFGLEEDADRAKRSFTSHNSDFMTIHNAFASWRRASANTGFVRKFCRQNFLSHQTLQQIEELRQQFLSYLVDSSFLRVDNKFLQELNRARYYRGYQTRFITVPPDYDRNSTGNSEGAALLGSTLCAGLYPKILAIDTTNHQIRTLLNNQLVAFHPSSVNFGKKLNTFAANYLCYFTIMQSKRLYAWETSPVDDLGMFLLCGDCEFKVASQTAILDRKIKFQIPFKSLVALKHLRVQIADIAATQYKGRPLSDSQQKWNELAIMLLRGGKQPALG